MDFINGINLRSKRPIANQIQEIIRKKIQAGELATGDQLPTVRSLADLLGVNFNTVARAYRRLDQDGLISMRQGRGTFVTPSPTASSPADSLAEADSKEEKLQQFYSRLVEESEKSGLLLEDVVEMLIRKGQRPQKIKDREKRKNKYRRNKQVKRISINTLFTFLNRSQRKRSLVKKRIRRKETKTSKRAAQI